jgi:DNA polymerase IV
MTAPAPRQIAHLDMNYFFAACEIARYPDLAGLPVVIGGRKEHQPVQHEDGSRTYARMKDYVGRGVVTTATYPARDLGVHSAMPMMKAAKLAPEAILLPNDFALYRHYSNLFKQTVAQIAPHIEDVGIDEIYIDLTGMADDARGIALHIKDAVHEVTGLTCSIGLSYCKRLAKLGSDFLKPNGLTVITKEDITDKIWPLNIKEVNGIGPKAVVKLNGLGIFTVGDIARAEPALLQEHFGRTNAAWLLDVAHGIDDRPVVTHWDPKQVSREKTFESDMHPRADRAALTPAFTELCTRVAQDLQRKGYVGKTVGVKVRYTGFMTVTRDYTLDEFTDDAAAIRRAAGECLKRVPLTRRIRLLGVRVSGLVQKALAPPPAPKQQDLFVSVPDSFGED